MQLTELQVERSLEALREPRSQRRESAPDVRIHGEVPVEVLRWLVDQPAVRADRLEEVRRRLATGAAPSAEALARRIVGRFVCDRLR
jgi:hypothetical protein